MENKFISLNEEFEIRVVVEGLKIANLLVDALLSKKFHDIRISSEMQGSYTIYIGVYLYNANDVYWIINNILKFN